MSNHGDFPPSRTQEQMPMHGLSDASQASLPVSTPIDRPVQKLTRRSLFTAGAALLAGSAAALISGSRVASAAEPQVETITRRSAPQVQREVPVAQMVQPKADRQMAANSAVQRQPMAVAQKQGSSAQAAPPETAAVPQTAAAQPAPGTTYTVRSGDTLSSISLWAYGSANYWYAIYEANHGVIGTNPDWIYPGQVLTIPHLNLAPPAPGPIGSHYTVQSGDTLSSIAWRMYGNSSFWSVIYEANRGVIGANPNLIRPGQVLAIPAY